MKIINLPAIYILWLREMKRTWRAKSRVIGTLIMPLFFLAFLGFGFRRAVIPGIPAEVNYGSFLTPGIIGMTMLFTSMFAGISVLWDKEFGFLKEIMVTPVSRTSIVLGRIAGGATSSLVQGTMILLLSTLLGFKIPNIASFFLALVLMCLISFTFIGLGLIFASRMKDIQGFSLIMNFVIFPLFFLSGALYPLDELPRWLNILAYLDPLTYGVDGLRAVLLGASKFSLLLDFGVIAIACVFLVMLGSYLFERSEVD
jgi:ABC-2 type transport system permease protein